MKFNRDNFLLLLLVFLISLAGLFLILETLNLNKIILGTKVANLSVSGLKLLQAEALLKEKSIQWQNQEIEFIYQNQRFLIRPKDLGISLDLEKTLNLAYSLGRNKNILLGLFEQINGVLPLGRDNNLSPVYSVNQEKFRQFIKENLRVIEKPAQNATLVFDRKIQDWQVIPAQDGSIIDRKKIREDLEKRIVNLISQPIKLSLNKDEPEVLETEVEQAKIKANQILNNLPYLNLRVDGEKSWPIDKETMLDWFEFKPVSEENTTNKILGLSLNQEKIKEVLIGLAPLVNQEPINAQLTVKDGRITVFALSQEGIKLEIEASAEKIAEKILAKANIFPELVEGSPELVEGSPDKFGIGLAFDSATSSPRSGNKLSIELVVSKTQPQITTESIDTLGLTSLLGKGISNFSGSPKNRIHNIKVGAAKFNGILLKSGEEFSFNIVLGEIGPAQGYLPELVIKKNKTIPEYGGGLCQVSTTAFRAAINSGLKIIERYAHAFPVRYYSPQGFDATVYPPHPDIRFINDTPKNLLIQSKIEGNNLIFEFYGTDDGRQIKIKGPIVLESKPDGSMKTILYQEIWRDDKLERQAKFSSNYKSPDLYPVERNPLE